MTLLRMLGCLVLLGAASPAVAQNTFTDYFTFGKPTWICRTADAFRSLETRLAETDAPGDLPCALITLDDVEDIMAPWVGIVGEQDDLVEVQFLVERYQRLRPPEVPRRGGRATRVEFVGWTKRESLEAMTTF